MIYTIKYKRGFLWRTLNNVVADGYFQDVRARYFVLDDDSVIEIPVKGTIFYFSPERAKFVDKSKPEPDKT